MKTKREILVESVNAVGVDDKERLADELHKNLFPLEEIYSAVEYAVNYYSDYQCDCGAFHCVDDIGDDAWRWNGECWQHQHEYPVGHVNAEIKKPSP